MFFDAPFSSDSPSGQAVQGQETLLSVAQSAARQLVADLEWARQLTRQWADEKLTDALVASCLGTCLEQLSKTGCWGETNQLLSNEFWRIAGPILEVGMLQHRARFKPRGYAGDYQMLHWICTNSCCDHPLGRAFDRYFQDQAAPAAVRSRTQQIATVLAAHYLHSDAASFHVASVGSGPADDIHQSLRLLPEDHRSRVRVTLLDLDPEALEFARQQVEPLLPSRTLECIRENLYRLPRRLNREKILGTPDFLVCSGLFDYLDDESAVGMLRLFWQRLGKGGLLLVGNFAPHNPTRAYMEWIGNWYLTYRTGQDLEKLAIQAEIPRDQFSIGTEPLGIDLLLIVRKQVR